MYITTTNIIESRFYLYDFLRKYIYYMKRWDERQIHLSEGWTEWNGSNLVKFWVYIDRVTFVCTQLERTDLRPEEYGEQDTRYQPIPKNQKGAGTPETEFIRSYRRVWGRFTIDWNGVRVTKRNR